MSILSKNLKKIRSVKGLSQSEFAKMFGLSRANIGSYEEGRAQPKMDVLTKIATHYNITLDDFVTKELSVNDLSNFSLESIGETVSGPVKESMTAPVAYLPEREHQQYFSLGRTKDTIHLPKQFSADLALEHCAYHMDHPRGFQYGDILLLKKIATSELKQGDVFTVLHKKEFITGICFLDQSVLYLKGMVNDIALLSIQLEDVQKVWKVTGKLGSVSMNYEKMLLKERIEQLEETVRALTGKSGE